ncbi:MAG: DUF4876 domain-containing protein [Alistipes sp.]|nr:DUF4876 domain-containing protein [Alistipes sp.]MDE6857620.1 DUF4876 domain-containing protein [Alistipes sp.]
MTRFTLHIIAIISSCLAAAGCGSLDDKNPYAGSLNTLRIETSYPEEFAGFLREGIEIRIEDVDRGYTYRTATDASGAATVRLTNGIYRIIASDKVDTDAFHGSADRVRLVDGDMTLTLGMIHSRSGAIVIKEIYCGGCMRAPIEGKYQYDKYVILHNNSSETEYLDGLCFGASDPYNSQANNVWVTPDPATGASLYPDFVPVIQAVWQFGGDGESFPLAPGEDAVICCCGAIDHAAQYPLSVDLNREGYFVLYNNTYFPNTFYHPAPGDRITPDRYLNVVIKTGIANAYPLSIYSPALVVFRAKGTTIQEFVADPANVIQKPGDKNDFIVKVPTEWIIDGAEVFYGGSSTNTKRLGPAIDAGYVTLSEIYLGRTLHRKVDEQASAEAGYEILVDTNNSSEDFYERSEQSLHE